MRGREAGALHGVFWYDARALPIQVPVCAYYTATAKPLTEHVRLCVASHRGLLLSRCRAQLSQSSVSIGFYVIDIVISVGNPAPPAPVCRVRCVGRGETKFHAKFPSFIFCKPGSEEREAWAALGAEILLTYAHTPRLWL